MLIFTSTKLLYTHLSLAITEHLTCKLGETRTTTNARFMYALLLWISGTFETLSSIVAVFHLHMFVIFRIIEGCSIYARSCNCGRWKDVADRIKLKHADNVA